MDPLHDPRCLVTTEALFVDGANGVCGTPRHRAGEAPPMFGVVVLVLMLLAAALASRVKRHRAVVGVALIALGALPGLWAIVSARADRPIAVELSASRVARAHDRVRAFAVARHGAHLRTETERAIVPVARLALTGLPDNMDAPIDLFDDTLEDGCRERGGALVCGTPPAPFPSAH